MYGLVFEKLESFVLEHHGKDAWHAVKEQADCQVPDGQFLRRSCYPDQDLVDLVVTASQLTSTPIPTILEAFGHYWYRQMHDHDGHATLLQCQGKTLRTWLSCLNAMHDHIQKSFGKEDFHAPIFWCEDCLEHGGDILLHYYSMRGALLVPMVVGVVKELAISQFDLEIEMEEWALQGEGDAEFTTWRISAKDPTQVHKLTPRYEEQSATSEGAQDQVIKCPFTGHVLDMSDMSASQNTVSTTHDHHHQRRRRSSLIVPRNPHIDEEQPVPSIPPPVALTMATSSSGTVLSSNHQTRRRRSSTLSSFPEQVPISLCFLQNLFPFHVLVDHDFIIRQVGCQLAPLLEQEGNNNNSPPQLLGKHIGEVLQISRPVLGTSWDWKALNKLADQHFFMVPCTSPTARTSNASASLQSIRSKKKQSKPRRKSAHLRHLKKRVSMEDTTIRFKAAMVELPLHDLIANVHHPATCQINRLVLFSLAPDARSVHELQSMGLCIPELPLHSWQRDAILLGEYIQQEMHRAHELDKLSKKLQIEKDLSNTLLYNMLPASIANELRTGQTVEPIQHDNVTLFFSDIVGFTNICAQVDPWAVIDMLNQLYSVMDHLAAKFNLYKVETIGDAYMCCSGLPEPAELHAENIANFAIAVMECCKHVKSPVDDTTPIQMRIGIHTGHCTAGVVGTLTPHYCLFGDMVNVTARHEQTGVAGKIQCSSDLFGKLKHFSSFEKEQYHWAPRGLVDMKGKGERYTYFLEGGTDDNSLASPAAVQELYEEVGKMLEKNTWKKRRYFRRSGALRSGSMSTSDIMSDATMSEFGDGSISQQIGGGGGDGSISQLQPIGDSLTADLSESDEAGGAAGEGEDGNNDDEPLSIASAAADNARTEESTQIDDLDLDLDVGDHLQGIESNTSSMEEKKETEPTEVKNGLVNLAWDEFLTREEMVAEVQQIMATVLKDCLMRGDASLRAAPGVLDGHLLSFVDQISKSFAPRNKYHSFRRALHQVAWANYLFDAVLQDASGLIVDNPWLRLTLLLAALVRDCKHSGVSGEQLQAENHMVYLLHGESTNCQVKFALSYAVNALEENYEELFQELSSGLPNFLLLFRRMTICKSPLDRFEKAMADVESGAMESTEAAAMLVLQLSTLGHYALDGEAFEEWNSAALSEKRIAYLARRGRDPRPTWSEECRRVAESEVVPLITGFERLLAKPTGLKDALLRNVESIECREMKTIGNSSTTCS